jgi:hypothetical protein
MLVTRLQTFEHERGLRQSRLTATVKGWPAPSVEAASRILKRRPEPSTASIP